MIRHENAWPLHKRGAQEGLNNGGGSDLRAPAPLHCSFRRHCQTRAAFKDERQ